MNVLRPFSPLIALITLSTIVASSFCDAASLGERLVNLSSRAQVGTGANILIAGFIINQGSPKKVLIRAIGPTLSSSGVSGVLADPVLTLFDSSAVVIATNDNWSAADAATFAEAGTVNLPVGSKDSAIVATLAPGAYTAQVTGLNGSTGVALVEVFDVTGSARLINLSTRAFVGTGDSVLIAGLIVPGNSGPRRLLIRALGPTLAKFGVGGVLSDPVIALINGSGVQISSNDDWEIGDKANVVSATALAGAAGFPVGSKDSALVATLSSGGYTVIVSGVGNTTGVALVEVYDLTPDTGAIAAVGVAATVSSTSPSGSGPAVFTFTRSGDASAALTVNYTLSGTAVLGTDYTGPAASSVTFAAGVSSTNINVNATASLGTVSKSLTLTLQASGSYALDTSSATITIFYGTGALYVSNLRSGAAAASSTGYGTSSLQLSADERFVVVGATFSNLSSPETVAYLRYGIPGDSGAYLFRLPNGQVSGAQWQIQATGIYTAADLVAAIKSGHIYLEIDSSNYPSGELSGTFVASTGSQAFTAPAAPPSLPSGAPTATDSARFLAQATFGPMKSEIDALPAKGLSTWLTEQTAMAPTSHYAAAQADYTIQKTLNSAAINNPDRVNAANRQSAWWKTVLTAPDQLRQRVAFALSEIFVISDQNGTVNNWQDGAANYYDMLANDAFGNFRQLLEDVTLSPMMGIYLTSIKNSKATSTTQPDENFAREVMQLFTIGLSQLQPDGTLKLDTAGLPIPTYNQTTITEMAKVFTGWQFTNPSPTPANFRSGGGVSNDYLQPMTLNPNFHEPSAKTIFNGIVLPANQGGTKDLKDALDALFNHANTAPLFCRQLIQRLVTSNPSPAYVYRVAQVFANNGSGVRGDLAAVVRAVFLDYEARSTSVTGNIGFGKQKEPLLRVTSILRAFGGATDSGRFPIFNPETNLSEASLRSPTVFNFFEPAYVLPGALAAAGLYAPEYQILTDTTAISIPNTLYGFIYATRGANTVGFTIAGLPPTSSATTVVDTLNLIFCANSMPTATRDRIASALTSMPAGTADTEKYRSAVYLTVSTQQAAIQK